jgi:hypothetical protein
MRVRKFFFLILNRNQIQKFLVEESDAHLALLNILTRKLLANLSCETVRQKKSFLIEKVFDLKSLYGVYGYDNDFFSGLGSSQMFGFEFGSASQKRIFCLWQSQLKKKNSIEYLYLYLK